MHTLLRDFQEKQSCKQKHFTVRKIYYYLSEATCSWRKMMLSRLSNSEKQYLQFKTLLIFSSEENVKEGAS
jgi:hypothetical protein